MTINERVERLRGWMRSKGVEAFITPSTDPHSGEYVPNHWKGREWISGFNGSAGTAVVTEDKAALWTDNRYFLAAAEQLKGTPFVLQKIGLEDTPGIGQWLRREAGNVEREEGDGKGKAWTVGVAGSCFTVAEFRALEQELKADGGGVRLVALDDPYDEVWEDRPGIPDNQVEIQPVEWTGETAAGKLERVRQEVARHGAGAVVISMLDEVAWTLNLRGTDVECNPVFVSYLVVSDEAATLFVNHEKVSDEVAGYLADEGVDLLPYEAVFPYLKKLDKRVMVQPEKTNCQIVSCLKEVVEAECPVSTMKIMKNETEIKGYRSAMLKDGIAMVKWMKWALEAIPEGGQTELTLTRKLYDLRAEQPLFRGVSFESIMGYAAHGAIVHYEPTEETDIPVDFKGLLLIDSGGQYRDGTTDVTRTIPLGEQTWEERRDYTLVLRGFIRLASCVFPRGTYGSQLDCLAREPMWKYGINYLHGTGHGVGSYLNVHEGPHQFRMNYMPQPLVPGMTITCEPGIYLTGKHGVRHENTMLVVEARLRECESSEGVTFGPYYQFEQLTLCPILTSPIVKELMQPEEILWFNQYQQEVYDRLAPHLDEEHRTWLYEVTRPI